MHIDGRTLPNGSLIEGDICIIGAGAAGISLALEWINTPYKIILLEGGVLITMKKCRNYMQARPPASATTH